MADLRTVLHDAAPDTVTAVEPGAIMSRGRQLRRRRVALRTSAPVASLVVVLLAAATLHPSHGRPNRVRTVAPTQTTLAPPFPAPSPGFTTGGGGGRGGTGGPAVSSGSPAHGPVTTTTLVTSPGGAVVPATTTTTTAAAHDTSVVLAAPFTADPETTVVCGPSAVAGTDATCSKPGLSADASTGLLKVGSRPDPFTVTSAANGTEPTDGWGDAIAALHFHHRLPAAATQVQVTFDYTVEDASVTYQGAGNIAADFRLYGELKGCAGDCYAYNQQLVLNSSGLPSYQGSIDQPVTIQLVVTLAAPNNGEFAAGTVLDAGAIVDGAIGFQSMSPYWSGKGSAEGRVALRRVTFSA